MLNRYTSVWDVVHRNIGGDVLWQGESRNSRFDEGNKLELDVFFRGAVAPSDFYIRLFNDTPIKADTLGTIASEPVGNGYAAQLIERSSVGWPTLDMTIPEEETGAAQAGAANTITLAAGANTNDDFYNISTIKITGGTGAGQAREIVDYNGTTKVAIIDQNWTVTPDNTSVYVIYSDYLLSSKVIIFTATGPWSTVTYAVLADVAAGIVGNVIAFFPLTQPRMLADGDSLEFSGKIKLG